MNPPALETFDHWPSWLNARGHLDRSACFDLGVAEARRLTGCVPMERSKKGVLRRARGREKYDVPDMPNELQAVNGKGRLSAGYFDVDAMRLEWMMRKKQPRRLGGDWRTARAPAMRNTCGIRRGDGMSAEQGGYGPGQFKYERGRHGQAGEALDVGLTGNPNRGACREKRLGLDDRWMQRVWMEKWVREGTFKTQYFLLCPGCDTRGLVRPCADDPCRAGRDRGGADVDVLSRLPRLSRVDRRGLRGLTGTTSNCGDGSRGAHDQGWVCGERVYKLFWVMARPGEVRDALMAERWIAGLSSRALARSSAAVSVLVERYGPIMGTRALRCRRCLRLRYGQSPDVLWKARRRRGLRRNKSKAS